MTDFTTEFHHTEGTRLIVRFSKTLLTLSEIARAGSVCDQHVSGAP